MIKVRLGLLLSKAPENKAEKAVYEQAKAVWFLHKIILKTPCVRVLYF